MNRRTIAVDKSLTPVMNMLRQEGYDVVDLGQSPKADCIVVSGGAINVMGVHVTNTNAPVISAEGRSAEDIVAEIRRHTH